MITPITRPAILTLASYALITATATNLVHAQTDVDFKWQKKHVVIKYNPVRLGKHELSELPVGGTWRMGMNTASTLSTDLPLVSDNGIVAPGSYRVSLLRSGEKTLGLQVVGSELQTAGASAYFPTELRQTKKTDTLELRWLTKGKGKKKKKKAKASDADGKSQNESKDPIDGKHGIRPVLSLKYGTHGLSIPITVIAGQKTKVRGFAADAFSWPSVMFADHLKKGHAIPILTLRGKGGSKSRPKLFNLLVTEKKAEFHPAMTAPTSSFGFGNPEGADPDSIREGTIVWSDSQSEVDYLRLGAVKAKGKTLSITGSIGKRSFVISVAAPSRK